MPGASGLYSVQGRFDGGCTKTECVGSPVRSRQGAVERMDSARPFPPFQRGVCVDCGRGDVGGVGNLTAANLDPGFAVGETKSRTQGQASNKNLAKLYFNVIKIYGRH